MKYQFKDKPKKLTDDKVLAVNKYGDVLLFKGKLIIPTGTYDKLVYSFINMEWQTVSGGCVLKRKTNKIAYFDDLIVKDNSFFDYLDLDDKESFIKEYYRDLREKMCYPIVNRGKLWYDHLTLAQHSELNDWYEAWLDITETHTIPVTPAWVDDKLTKIEPEELI